MTENNKIKFYSSFIPKLTNGELKITSTQQISGDGISQHNVFNSSQSFYIAGPKFEIEPNTVHHVYPPRDMLGDYIADVPSIVFNRVSLPWERKRKDASSDDDSWLFLFMVNEDEKKQLQEGRKKAKEIFKETINNQNGLETRNQEDLVNYLIISENLKKLFPKKEEYKFLSYVRTEVENSENTNPKKEKSVILCNRLPTPGKINTVYLLSLDQVNSIKESISLEKGAELYPYLYSWSFYCNDNKNYLIPKGSKDKEDRIIDDNITEILYDNTKEFEKVLTEKSLDKDYCKSKFRFNGGTFHGLLHTLKGELKAFRYSSKTNNGFVNQGGVLLKENIKIKGYRSPFQSALTELLLKDSYELNWIGINGDEKANLEQSYQVAYELGRLTALKDESFHKSFFEWKCEVSAEILNHKNKLTSRNSEFILINNTYKPLSTIVKDKIEGWSKLKDIPYHYLIPSNKMIPEESIRTFCVDRNWINAFILGALSIGNTYDEVEPKLYSIYIDSNIFLKKNLVGFIINSIAVGGWPDYEVDAESETGNKLNQLIRKVLNKNIELFLYHLDNVKSLTEICFHLPQGKTHSGFRYEKELFIKQYRKPDNDKDTVVNVVIDENYLIKLEPLIQSLDANKQNASNFGMMMLEGTPKVNFIIN